MKRFLILSIMLMVAVAAIADRKALVIGISEYEGFTLASPVNDAAAMENALGSWGFAVTKHLNPTELELEAALNDFAGSVSGEDDVFFYFSGFVVSQWNSNFIMPAGTHPAVSSMVSQSGKNLARVSQVLKKANNLILMIESGRSLGTTGGRSKGYPMIRQAFCDRSQSLILSAAPGRVIPDSNLEHSAFTAAFIQKFDQSEDPYNETIQDFIREFRAEDPNRQVPWFTGYLKHELYFNQTGQRWFFKNNWMDIEGGGSLSW